MSKSEENANIAYPITRGSEIDRIISMVNKRNGYIQGYEKAKKDIKDFLLELIEEEEKFWDTEIVFRRLKNEIKEL